MKKWILIFTFLAVAKLSAQTNAPVRLALVTESSEAMTAADILTAQLSSEQKIHLLERDEIGKVYREQGMSEANRDDLKLGRILGADGLLLLNVVRTPQATNLTSRLIAVKPGMVLTDGSFPWPLKDTSQWAESVSTYLDSFLPKLTVLAKDAIPLSIVNLRAAVSSADEQEVERQLKLLTIQRLSQERQLFVLERQRMQLLSEEKQLKSDETAFWDGSYLLDGIVDQNGYSRDTVAINARLIPPKGGTPLSFEVSGSRTNLAEVVNRLAAKVTELLKVNSTVPQWSAAKEAEQYFQEAKWALKWGIYPEAQAAVDSAWALGKRDTDCAIVRVKAYILQVTANIVGYQTGESSYDCLGGYGPNNRPLGPPVNKSVVEARIKQIANEHSYGIHGKTNFVASQNLWVFDYVSADRPPDPKNIEYALHALDLYYQFSRNSPDDLLKVGSQETGWANSEWYNLGIADLDAASMVLQNFNFVPEAQKSVADRLADLRALARSVADWISQSPSVHDSYFVGARIATHDELAYTIGGENQINLNIFNCQAEWGCFWQEHPKDTIELYRRLMSSSVFCYLHQNLWLRPSEQPRLVAWNEEDEKRIPQVWDNFIQELGASSNVLWQLEAKAFQLADANDEKQMAMLFTNLFDAIFESREALVNNNVEVLYLDWRTGDLVSAMTGNGIASDTKDSLQRLYYSEYRPKIEAMDQEYRTKTVQAGQFLSVFEKQKQYLKENKPYDFFEFAHTFLEGAPNYSKAQALEIKPLLEAYKSNLVAQSKSASGRQKGELMGAIAQVGFVENNINRVLHSVALQSNSQSKVPTLKPAPQAGVAATISVATNTPEIITNVIAVNKFFPIPWERLIDLGNFQQIEDSQVNITAHHWFEGRLILNFQYSAGIRWFNEKREIIGGSNAGGSAIAIFNPETEQWEVIGCPKVDFVAQNNFYHRSALLNGDLFNCDGGQIRKYDFLGQQWKVLKISDGNNYELFVVDGHLYAANGNVIFEIIDGGNATRILASTRRQPPMSVLDTQDLGTPTLFSGPDHSFRVSTKNKIFTWTGSDWREDSTTPPASSQLEIFLDGVLFRQPGFLNAGYQNGVIGLQKNGTYGTVASLDQISCLQNASNQITLYLNSENQTFSGRFFMPGEKAVQASKPLWKTPANLLPNLPVALHQSDLYLFEGPFASHVIINDQREILQEKAVIKNNYDATLLCFSPDSPLPQKSFLKFDASDAQTPNWMFPTTNFLFLGAEIPLNSPFGSFDSGSGRAGVWIMPISVIDVSVTAQKQIQLARMAQDKKNALAVEEQQRKVLGQQHKNLLARYDLNHNGRIDPEEREAALNDPIFIESELDAIDTNHNDRLDAPELVWFDANRNGILDPPEQAGIEIAQKLLVARMIKDFDQDGDGQLDQNEFANVLSNDSSAGRPDSLRAGMNFFQYDQNHDGKLNPEELKLFLEQWTLQNVRRGVFQTQPHAIPILMRHPQPTFKEVLEIYWKGVNQNTNHSVSSGL